MNELTLHPNVYATGHSKGLINILERVWVRDHDPGYTLSVTQVLPLHGLTTRKQVMQYLPNLQHYMYPGRILILTGLNVVDSIKWAPTVKGPFGVATVLVYGSKTSPEPTYCAGSPATKPCQSKYNIKGV